MSHSAVASLPRANRSTGGTDSLPDLSPQPAEQPHPGSTTLCRCSAHEPTTRFHGSGEHAALLSATALRTPSSTATESERWVLIDRTCQWMYVGAGTNLVFAFPTSTGSDGYETRSQDRTPAFRYNPAVENGGWHDSTEYPVGVDNPLNGNLYKPLYFDLGQAIHGANNVPPEPASKGCARLSVTNQERLLEWLGLLDATEETWRKNEINLTVNVQGAFIEA
ncbi:MAG: L,D-transpeptidase [Ilumatobacter fluminis]